MSYKKLVIIANSPFTVLNFRKELIIEFVRLGGAVVVICPSHCDLLIDEEIQEELSKIGAEFFPLEISRSGLGLIENLRYLASLYFFLKKCSPTHVLNFTVKPILLGSIASHFAGVQSICSNITGIGFIFSSEAKKAWILRPIVLLAYRWALSFNRCVFFQNIDDKNLFVQKKIVRESCSVILNGSGVDIKRFKRIGTLPIDCSFIYCGRLLKDKGIYEYAAAAKTIRKRYPGVRFSVVGGLDDNPESLSARELDELINDSVFCYFGSVADVKPLLELHQVLVLPSYREGTPRSVLEGMSMGMPIITTNAPGCRDTVIHGWNGYLVEPRSVSSLTDFMLKIIENQAVVEDFGKNSRQRAVEKYNVDNVVTDTVNGLLNGPNDAV